MFVLTLIVGAIVNYVISQLVDKTGLSGTDRVLGAAFRFSAWCADCGCVVIFLWILLPILNKLIGGKNLN